MHIADLLENSLRAGAKRIELRLALERGTFRLEVEDDGMGMEPELLRKSVDPFFTTKERGEGVGLGIPLLLQTVEELGGTAEISTRPGGGTRVEVELPWHHPDRPPLGDLAETLVPIILTSPGVDFRIVLQGNGREVEIDVTRLREELGEGPRADAGMLELLERTIADAVRTVGLKEGS
ncbi:ATP-binding protein [Candidatus Bipolaricaulota sp. J31]